MAKRKGKEEQELWEWCGQVQLFLVVPSPPETCRPEEEREGQGEHKGKDTGKGQGAKNNKNDKLEPRARRAWQRKGQEEQQNRALAEGEA